MSEPAVRINSLPLAPKLTWVNHISVMECTFQSPLSWHVKQISDTVIYLSRSWFVINDHEWILHTQLLLNYIMNSYYAIAVSKNLESICVYSPRFCNNCKIMSDNSKNSLVRRETISTLSSIRDSKSLFNLHKYEPIC